MDRVLWPHGSCTVAICIDDIVIYNESWAEHMKHIGAVLRALKKAGLMANTTKCWLATQEVTYPGYIVMGGGQLQTLVDKDQALKGCPIPSTKKQVQHLGGLVGY